MDLRDYLRVLRQRYPWVVAATLVGGLLAALVTMALPRTYETQAQVFVSVQGQDTDQMLQGSSFSQQRVKSYAETIRSPLVLDPVIEELGLPTTASELAENQLRTTVPLDTVLIDLTVRDQDPEQAAAIANAVLERFAEVVPALEGPDGGGGSPVQVTVLQQGTPPESPASPRLSINVAAGLLLGLLAGLGLALVRHVTDTVVRREEDVARVTDTAVLGSIPLTRQARQEPVLGRHELLSARAEHFRDVRTNLQFVQSLSDHRSVLFTSCLPSEGKSTTTANLALTTAHSGATVCLVEADMRRPRLVDYLGMVNSVGLSSLLIGDVDLGDLLQPVGDTGVSFLSSGIVPPNPSELLGSPAMADLVRQLEERFDHVFIDGPPLLPVTDAAVIAQHTGGVVVVVGAGVVRREQLAKGLDKLAHVGARILGLVLNRVPTSGADADPYQVGTYSQDPVSPDRSTSRRTAREGIERGRTRRRRER